MLRPTKKLFARIGAAIIVGAAFASVAIAADSAGSGASSLSAAAKNAASNVSLPAAAGQTAVLVLEAVAGGSNPSTAASRRSDPGSPSQAKKDGPSSLISAAQGLLRAGTAGTVGMRPGWGCGKQDQHSGPPGRPDATPPPGCNR